MANTIMIGVTPPGGSADVVSGAITFESDSGNNVAIINYYEQVDTNSLWGTAQTNQLLAINAHHGSVPMMTWQPAPWALASETSGSPYTLAAFADGQFDAVLQSYAEGIKAYGGLVLIRWAHEFNGNWYAWGIGNNGNTPTDYINAWNNLVDIFSEIGCLNAQFVWCPNISTTPNDFAACFPGEENVDWIGLDGYNWNNPSWLSFNEVFDSNNSYENLVTLSNKPVIIAEFACAEGPQKPGWITDAFSVQIPNRTNLFAVVWFNVDEDGENWTIESSQDSESAFSSGIASQSYSSSWSYPPELPTSQNMLVNPDLTGYSIPNWGFTVSGSTQATLGSDENYIWIEVTAADPSSPWNVQLYQVDINITSGTTYTVSFEAMSQYPRLIGVAMSGTNFYESAVQVGVEWQEYTFSFTAPTTLSSALTFNFGQSIGFVCLRNLSLVEQG